MDSICTTALPSIGVGVLLFFSEILPFISTVKANGITEFVVKVLLKFLHKKQRDLDLETGNGGSGEGEDGLGNDELDGGLDNCEENDSLI